MQARVAGCVAGALLATMAGSCSRAQDAPHFAPPPAGFIGFCVNFPDQCTTPTGGSTTVALTMPTLQRLRAVNRTINRAIWPLDDATHYGRPELWTIPTDGLGDCDDYAVTKRAALIASGFPVRALRLAVVFALDVGRHAVLTVATDQGDLVLDNLTDDIRPSSATGYIWIEQQDGANPMQWIARVAVPDSAATTAAVAKH